MTGRKSLAGAVSRPRRRDVLPVDDSIGRDVTVCWMGITSLLPSSRPVTQDCTDFFPGTQEACSRRGMQKWAV